MTDNQLAYLSVLTSLNKMMAGGHFSICTLDEAVKTLGAMPDGAAMRILRPLHCVNWIDMDPELRAAVPKLIERCINVPAHQFALTEVSAADRAVVTKASIRFLTR